MTMYYTVTDGKYVSSKLFRTLWAAQAVADRRSALTGRRRWYVRTVWVDDEDPAHRVLGEA